MDEGDAMEEQLLKCLKIALKYNVSDIHFRLLENQSLQVEMRINGKIFRLKDRSYDVHFFRYLLYRANMDVSDFYTPQTGQFRCTLEKQVLSLRFSILSSNAIVSGVLRILNNHSDLVIDDLFASPIQADWFHSITNHTSGLFIFSGPTGSGKTTSLYTILNQTKGKKIYTLEDPIEVYSNHYVQIQINEKHNLSYSEGIKQLMRQDPDIIMVGEIRDSIAAQMAVRSALTGHLVLTSIHASSCESTIHRLLDLGVNAFQLQDVLYGIANQRLFHLDNGKKVSVYEIMNRKEVLYYFKHQQTSQSFIPLSSEVETAKQRYPEIQNQMETTNLDFN